jgi:iron-sulfur cluster assembly protein
MPALETESCVTLASSAVAALERVLRAAGHPGLGVRVRVEPGGCSGLRYQVGPGAPEPGDLIQESNGIEVIVDPASAALLQGAVVRHTEAGFAVDNPNARGTCICGATFSAKA